MTCICAPSQQESSPPQVVSIHGDVAIHQAHVNFAERVAVRLIPLVKDAIVQELEQDWRELPNEDVGAFSSSPERNSAIQYSSSSLGLAGNDSKTVSFCREENLDEKLSQCALAQRFVSDEQASSSPSQSNAVWTVRPEMHLKKEFSLTSSLKNVESMDWRIKFQEFDPDSEGLVTIERVFENCPDDSTAYQRAERIKAIKTAVTALNKSLQRLHRGDPEKLSFHSFNIVMSTSEEEIISVLGGETSRVILDLRKLCIQENLREKVAVLCQVDETEVDRISVATPAMELNMRWVRFIVSYRRFGETTVAIAILLNSLEIGVSLDNYPDWGGWQIIEGFFAFFFTCEFLIRLWHAGPCEHFLGEDWAWNWFDCVIVLFALFDTTITLVEVASADQLLDMGSLTVFRLFRLVRILRLVRLLRFKMFKQLSLMLGGVMAGMRTLMWAMVFLFVIVYALGVVLRQVMDPARNSYKCKDAVLQGMQLDTGFFKSGANCNRGAYVLEEYGRLMFKNVFRAMVTIFVCLTDGCSAPDGTPMIWHWWDAKGALLVFGYLFVYVFVTFGIFNLILAIFVENTLARANLDEQLRTSRKHADHVRKAQMLRKLLCRIFCMDSNTETGHSHKSGLSEKGLRGKIAKLQRKPSELDCNEAHLLTRVSREAFEQALESDEVRNLLEDLEVSMSSRENLFPILDADDNGELTITEIADGIMRLRGPADKGDSIAAVLSVAALQKHLRSFEQAVLHNHTLLRQTMQHQQMDHDVSATTKGSRVSAEPHTPKVASPEQTI